MQQRNIEIEIYDEVGLQFYGYICFRQRVLRHFADSLMRVFTKKAVKTAYNFFLPFCTTLSSDLTSLPSDSSSSDSSLSLRESRSTCGENNYITDLYYNAEASKYRFQSPFQDMFIRSRQRVIV